MMFSNRQPIKTKFVREPELIQHRHKVTPYLGLELLGVVKDVL